MPGSNPLWLVKPLSLEQSALHILNKMSVECTYFKYCKENKIFRKVHTLIVFLDCCLEAKMCPCLKEQQNIPRKFALKCVADSSIYNKNSGTNNEDTNNNNCDFMS